MTDQTFKDILDLEPENRKINKYFHPNKCAADESFLTRKGHIDMGK